MDMASRWSDRLPRVVVADVTVVDKKRFGQIYSFANELLVLSSPWIIDRRGSPELSLAVECP